MRIVFQDKKLEKVYLNNLTVKTYSKEVLNKFNDVLEWFEASESINDVGRLKGFRLHKLKGDLKKCFSISLDKKWRLIVKFEKDENGNIVVVIKLTNHYD